MAFRRKERRRGAVPDEQLDDLSSKELAEKASDLLTRATTVVNRLNAILDANEQEGT